MKKYNNAKEFLDDPDTYLRLIDHLSIEYKLTTGNLISQILYEWYTGFKVTSCWRTLNTSTINANDVRIDFNNQVIKYSKYFSDFLDTKQLSFNWNIDANSIFQLLEYHETYPNCYINYDLIFRYLNTIIKYTGIYQLDITPYNLSKYNINLLKQYFHIDNNKLTFNNNKIINELEFYEIELINNYGSLYNTLYGHNVNKQTKNYWLYLLKDYIYLADRSLGIYNYFNQLPNGWKSKLPGLNKLIKEHHVQDLFKSKTLKEQIEIYDIINEFVKLEGLWIIGLIERKYYLDTDNFRDGLIKDIKDHKTKLINNKVTPLPVTSRYLGCEIVELINGLQLLEEGTYNHHCVGGYYNHIDSELRIFSIRYMQYKFTTECRYNKYNKKWIVNQCKAFNNKEPKSFGLDKLIGAVSTKLVNELNNLYCP